MSDNRLDLDGVRALAKNMRYFKHAETTFGTVVVSGEVAHDMAIFALEVLCDKVEALTEAGEALYEELRASTDYEATDGELAALAAWEEVRP